MQNNGLLDISWGTIFKVALGIVIFYIIFLVKDILILFVFGLIISILLDPAIKFLTKLRIPRIFSSILIYLSIFALLGLFIFWTAPLFGSQVKSFLIDDFPQYFGKLSGFLSTFGVESFDSAEKFTDVIGVPLQDVPAEALGFLVGVFESVGSILFILSIAFFLSLEEKGMERLLGIFSPRKHEAYVLSIWNRTRIKVAGWFGSRVLTSLFVGLGTFITLYLFRVEDYALSLALIAAVLDFIPILGPIFAGLIAFIFIALTDNILKAAFFLGAFFLIQQIEGNILGPILTKKFVGLPPVLVLLSVAIGAQLLGVLGAILVIPIAGIIFEFTRDFLKGKKEEKPVIV